MEEHFSYVEWEYSGYTLRGSIHETKEAGGVWVIFSHGFTSHRMGPEYLYVSLSRNLSAHGINSLRFDYTGAGESDGDFCGMTLKTMGDDLASAACMIRQRYHPDKILILGHSLGGFVALTIGCCASVDGLILMAPVARPIAHIPQYEHIIAVGENKNGLYELGPFQLNLSFLQAIKTSQPVEKILPPFQGRMLIIHGDGDKTVPVEEGQFLADKCDQFNIPINFCVLNGADHRFSTVEHRERLQHTILSWIKELYL